jgi:hypothetical protein
MPLRARPISMTGSGSGDADDAAFAVTDTVESDAIVDAIVDAIADSVADNVIINDAVATAVATAVADAAVAVAVADAVSVAVVVADVVADSSNCAGGLQFDAPGLEKKPLGHGRHAVLPTALKVPESHNIQVPAETAPHEVLNVPAGHRVQATPPML